MTTRWGLLGCGDIAQKRVADAIQRDERSELLFACRQNAAALKTFCESFRIPQFTTSAEEICRSSEIDAIYIATPVYLHCEQTIAAAEAGKHVLVEKPMALDPEECQRMIDACRASGVQLSVAYYRQFYPVIARTESLLSAGKIGRPLSVLATTGNANRFPKDDWRVVGSLGGGGSLMDIGSHRIDLFLKLFGDCKSVQARCGTSPDFESEDMATLLMEFESGVHGTLQCYFGTVETPDRFEIIGTDGRIAIESLNDGAMDCHINGKTTREFLPPHKNLHAPLIADFTAALASARAPVVTGEVGKKTNDIIAQAYANARTR